MNLKGYADYEECRLPWLGRYPRHWSLTKTKRVCSFTTGWTPPTGDSAAYEGDCPWANISDLGQRVIFDTAKSISAKAAEDHGLELIPAGSLMFSFKLSVGQVAFAGKPMFSNEAIASFRESADLDLGFAYYAFPIFLIENAAENIYGAKLLNQFLIREAKFPLPPKPEQRVIATFLDRETVKIDALIAEQERLLTLLAEKRQAVISHAVTKGLNPDAPMKDSGVTWLGDIPKHWGVVPLKYVVDLRSGGTPSKDRLDYWDGHIPWASARDLKVDELSETALNISQKAIDDGAANLVPSGAVLVVVRGMILARTFPVAETRVPMAINQDLKALIPRESLYPSFLAWLLRGSAEESLQRLDEAGHGTKALRMDAWTSIQLPLPPKAEQVEIADYIRSKTADIDALSLGVRRSIELLEERRSALIVAAVSGQIDVSKAA